MYMREYWVQVHKSPIVYRYVDWTITVPLQMIEFNLILKAAGKATSPGMFWRLLVGTVVMLLCGEAGGTAANCPEAVATSFNYMRMIVTVGWSISPLGYLFGYLLGAVDEVYLNVTYNIADFVNKIAFVTACWSCAKSETEKDRLMNWKDWVDSNWEGGKDPKMNGTGIASLCSPNDA